MLLSDRSETGAGVEPSEGATSTENLSPRQSCDVSCGAVPVDVYSYVNAALSASSEKQAEKRRQNVQIEKA